MIQEPVKALWEELKKHLVNDRVKDEMDKIFQIAKGQGGS